MELICIEYKLWIKRNGFCGWPVAHPEVLKGDYLVHGLNYCQFLKCLQKVRLVRTEERRGGTCSSGPGSPAGRLRVEQAISLPTGPGKPFPIHSPNVWSDFELEAQPSHSSISLSCFYWLNFGSWCSSVCEIKFQNIFSKTSNPWNMQKSKASD